jgi:thiamine pyrophosphokinase
VQDFLKKLKKEQIISIIGPLASKVKSNTNLILAVDGGAKFRPSKNRSKNYISLGDNDSYQGQLDILLPKNKDLSDLQFAFNFIGKNAQFIFMKGFISNKKEKRFDHLLSLFGTVFLHSKKYQSLIWIDDDLLMLPKGEHHINIHSGFGLITFEPTNISLTGKVKYAQKTKKKIMPLSSLAGSNLGSGLVKITNDKACLLCLNKKGR